MPDRYRVILSKQFGKDLQGIFDKIAKDSPNSAADFIGKILDSFESLMIFPHRNVIPGQKPTTHPVRSLPVQSYLIFFKVLDEQAAVILLRARHGARRPLKRFE